VPSILFVKTSSLGDVVHNCPAVGDAARRVPGAAIDWVVEEAFADIATLHGAVRRVIPVAVRRWRAAPLAPATWGEVRRFAATLRSERYDFVLDSQGLAKSALVAALALGPKHGLDRASVREPFAARFYDSVHAVPAALHAVERNRRLVAAALGGPAPEGGGDYGLRVEGAAPPDLPPLPPAFAVLLTMTSRDDKLWPEEHWRALGAVLEARGIQCLLPWGSEEERRRCARIAAAIRGARVPRRMTLGEIARLMRLARCAIGVDTGLCHLAAALEVPAVGLYCGSDPGLTGLHAERVRNLGTMGRPPEVADVLDALQELI